MLTYVADVWHILIALLLVGLNGFFVAAEFALVRVRASRIDLLVQEGRPFAHTARWLLVRMDGTLSACQLGITMASLGLGWIGEPAFAHMLRPVLAALGIGSEVAVHTVAFVLAFAAITAAHLVVGEQAPKIYAIRRPEVVLLWSALPMRLFYYASYPLLVSLNACTAFLLRRAGLSGGAAHDAAHSEEEIRAMLTLSHRHGELTRSEHRLLDAVFDFDDMICRRVMVPRTEIAFFDLAQPVSAWIELATRTKHSRYPVCEGSLDHVAGIVHIKDLLGVNVREAFDPRAIIRPASRVPETMPISRLLRQFQSSRRHMAFVVDEHGTLLGAVMLENVLERIVGSLQDEFDAELPDVVDEGPGGYLVRGSAPVEVVNREVAIDLPTGDADTLSGLLVARLGRNPERGDRVDLDQVQAEVLEIQDTRATKVRLTRPVGAADAQVGET